MPEPGFTVVIAAYDVEDTIEATLRSVLAQTREDFEVVVVDDGSTDGTAARVGAVQDPRIRLIRQDNQGPAAARNRAIAESTAPLISLLDGDDLWLPTYLERMGARLDADPGAGWAYTDAWLLDANLGGVLQRSAMALQSPPDPPPATAEEAFGLLLERNFVYNSVTVRRGVVERVGGVDERLQAAVDWEWWLRMASCGERPVCVPGRLALYRVRPVSIQRNPVRRARNMARMWRLVAEEYDLAEPVRAELRARARRFDAEVAALEGRRPLAAARFHLRRRLGPVKRRIAPGMSRLVSEPPRELVEAFGDLSRV